MALINKSPATAYATTDVLYPGTSAQATVELARALVEIKDDLDYKAGSGTAFTVTGGSIAVAP